MWPFRKRARGGEVRPSWVNTAITPTTPFRRPATGQVAFPESVRMLNLRTGTIATVGQGWAKCLHCDAYFIGDWNMRVHFAAMEHACR